MYFSVIQLTEVKLKIWIMYLLSPETLVFCWLQSAECLVMLMSLDSFLALKVPCVIDFVLRRRPLGHLPGHSWLLLMTVLSFTFIHDTQSLLTDVAVRFFLWTSIILSVQFSHPVVSNSLWPRGLQHARLPCPSPVPGACSNSCPSSQWCHPTISSLSSPSPPAFSLSQHQGLFQGVNSSHQVAKVLELQLQHHSFQRIFRTDFL